CSGTARSSSLIWAITACSSSFFVDAMRSCSPWVRTCTLGWADRIRFVRSRASSSAIPLRSFTTWRTLPFAAGSGFCASSTLMSMPRRCTLLWSTSSIERSWLSDAVWMVSVAVSSVISTGTFLKSYRVVISRRVWSTALTSSWRSKSLTTSKENSCAIPRQDTYLLFPEIGQQLVHLNHFNQHLARLAPLARTDDAVLRQLVDQSRGPRSAC